MRKTSLKPFLPVIILFLCLTAFFIVGRNLLDRWAVAQEVLLGGNALLFLITLVSYLLAVRGLHHTNPHAFVRAVYGSILLKLFACMIAAFIYIAIYRQGLNKPALFTCMALYLVYTFSEVSILTKLLKQNRG